MMSERIYLNNDWKFAEQFEASMTEAAYDDSVMQNVRLPHTCKETPLHYFDEHCYQMVSGYRRVIEAEEAWKGKKILLTIDGAAHDSEVFLNGDKVGEHHCGYTAFTMDISGVLRYGEKNILVVKVDSREDLNIPPFGYVIDYMTYGGIYRDVYLDIKNKDYIEDIFIRTNIGQMDDQNAELISEVTVQRTQEGLFLKQSLKNKKTGEYQPLGESEISGTSMQLSYPVENVILWELEHPELYEVKTELICDGTLMDERIDRIGFRRAEFKKDGFYLNGKKIKLRGLNRHQSYPYVGYAMPKSMQRLDADILKRELGANAVRTSHYPQSHYFIERCDEIGLLVFTEIPGWQHIGDAAWKDQAVENVRDMVKQYRNHTSIILWGVRINESQDDDAFYRRTNAAAHEFDDSRPTGGVRANRKSSLLEDVYTYNDFVHDGKAKGCEPKKNVTSDMEKPYLISEYNGHMYPTKAFDWEEHRTEHALRHANVLDAVAAEEDIAGCFGWCMFDYNTHKDFGSGDRICYHGVMDMFRNSKLAAAVYACQQEKEPVLELSSSMDIGEHPGCNRGETYIFTNADKVRMYKNDRFIKEYSAADSPYTHLKHGPILIDDFIGDALQEEHMKPGQEAGVKKALNAFTRFGFAKLPKSIYATGIWLILRYHMNMEEAVRLYNKYIGDWGGTSTTYRFEAVMVDVSTRQERVVKTIIKEPMTERKISAVADHENLIDAESYDVAEVRIQAQDEHGNILSFYNEPLTFETEGPIEIIGPKTVALQGGMGGAYVKSKRLQPGEKQNAALIIRDCDTEIKIGFTVQSERNF